MPALNEIIDAPVAQALPYIYHRVMGSAAGGLALTCFVLVITFFCSVSITVTSSRSTWAFARDNALPYSSIWSRFSQKHDCPIQALALMTLVQMALGLISLGSTSAFNAFISVGVIALSIAYAIPIILSMKGSRKEVRQARWQAKSLLGWAVNILALAWIVLEIVLFALPAAQPVTSVSMNYAAVVFVGLSLLTVAWYFIHARHGKFYFTQFVRQEDMPNNLRSLPWTPSYRLCRRTHQDVGKLSRCTWVSSAAYFTR
jgi:amino acid transporter